MRHTLLNNLADCLRLGSLQFVIGQAQVPPAAGLPAEAAVVLQFGAGPVQGQLAIRQTDLNVDDPQKVIENMLADAIAQLGAAVRKFVHEQQGGVVVAKEGDVPPAPKASKLKVLE